MLKSRKSQNNSENLEIFYLKKFFSMCFCHLFLGKLFVQKIHWKVFACLWTNPFKKTSIDMYLKSDTRKKGFSFVTQLPFLFSKNIYSFSFFHWCSSWDKHCRKAQDGNPFFSDNRKVICDTEYILNFSKSIFVSCNKHIFIPFYERKKRDLSEYDKIYL